MTFHYKVRGSISHPHNCLLSLINYVLKIQTLLTHKTEKEEEKQSKRKHNTFLSRSNVFDTTPKQSDEPKRLFFLEVD